MKFILLLLVAGAGAYLFPQLYEGVGTPCQAVESKALGLNAGDGAQNTVLGNMALSLTNGGLGREMAADQYPDLPVRLGCIATYYNFPEDWQR